MQPLPLPGLKLCRPHASGPSLLFASAVVHASRRRRLQIQSGCALAQLVLSAWCSTAWRTHRKSCLASGVTAQRMSATGGKRRRDAAEAAADSIPSGIWELFFARCKAAKLDAGELPSSSKPIPRGIALAVRIGQRRHQHASTARKEQRWAAQKQSEAVVQTSGESIASSGCRRRCSTAT